MRLFYTSDINTDQVVLSPEESKHLAKVLRLTEGTEVLVCDGKGKRAPAVVSSADKNQAVIKLTGTVQEEPFPGVKITMAVGLTRQFERFEWFLEKVTEAGVYKIQPILTERSETRSSIKRSRWEKILLNAMKQSQRSYLPILEDPVDFKTFVNKEKNGLIAWCGSYSLPHIGKVWNKKATDMLTILIGPEGDFTEEEFNLALKAGYEGVNLGPLRLRTETAALAACILIKIGYEQD